MDSLKGLCTNIIQVFLATTHPRGNHPSNRHTHTDNKTYRYIPQATDSNLPSNRHTPIKDIPIHSTSYRQQSPKQPTHTDKTPTETFHRLPTIRQHPERETIKKQSQTITQATDTFSRLLLLFLLLLPLLHTTTEWYIPHTLLHNVIHYSIT